MSIDIGVRVEVVLLVLLMPCEIPLEIVVVPPRVTCGGLVVEVSRDCL